MKKIVTLLVMAVNFISCYADEWILIYKDDEREAYFLDEITESQGNYLVWEKVIFTKPIKLEKGTYIYSSKTYNEYDPEFDKYKTHCIIAYDKKGKVVFNDTDSYPSWNFVVPETIGAEVADGIYYWLFE